MSQPPEDPIKALWQGQEPEIPNMTVQAVRLLVKDNEARERRNIACSLVIAAAVTGIFVVQAWTAMNPLLRVADIVMLAWTPTMVWMQYRRWPRRAPGAEASAQGLVDFYRAEVVRQAPDPRLIGLSLAPIGVGLVLLTAAVWEKVRNFQPWLLWVLVGFVVFWAVVVTLQLRRHRRRLARRLRDIDALRG